MGARMVRGEGASKGAMQGGEHAPGIRRRSRTWRWRTHVLTRIDVRTTMRVYSGTFSDVAIEPSASVGEALGRSQ